MLRRAFLRRMALAAAARAFIDVPWPKVAPREGEWVQLSARVTGWTEAGRPIVEADPNTVAGVDASGRLWMAPDWAPDQPVMIGEAPRGSGHPFSGSAWVRPGIRTIEEMRALART